MRIVVSFFTAAFDEEVPVSTSALAATTEMPTVRNRLFFFTNYLLLIGTIVCKKLLYISLHMIACK